MTRKSTPSVEQVIKRIRDVRAAARLEPLYRQDGSHVTVGKRVGRSSSRHSAEETGVPVSVVTK